LATKISKQIAKAHIKIQVPTQEAWIVLTSKKQQILLQEAAVVRADFSVVGVGQYEHEQIFPHKGWVEHDPVEISLSVSKPAEKIKQEKVVLAEGKKVGFMSRFFEAHPDVQSAVVFVERKTTARRLAQELVRRNLSAVAMHADLDQAEREENLRLFKARQVRILVATDIVSRGIDVEDIALVVNFNVPQTVEAYVHRVGRTARAELGQPTGRMSDVQLGLDV